MHPSTIRTQTRGDGSTSLRSPVSSDVSRRDRQCRGLDSSREFPRGRPGPAWVKHRPNNLKNLKGTCSKNRSILTALNRLTSVVHLRRPAKGREAIVEYTRRLPHVPPAARILLIVLVLVLVTVVARRRRRVPRRRLSSPPSPLPRRSTHPPSPSPTTSRSPTRRACPRARAPRTPPWT